MMKIQIKFKGLRELRDALDPASFERVLKTHIRPATVLNGLTATAMIRKNIQNGNYAENAPLTTLIKGSSKPLVDRGDLFQAVTHMVMNDTDVVSGIMKTDKAYNIAVAIHDGQTVQVTPAMRGMFYVLWLASTGQMPESKLSGRAAELYRRNQDWKPLRASTTRLVTPARPFVYELFKSNGELKKRVRDNWQKAIQAAFREISAKVNTQ